MSGGGDRPHRLGRQLGRGAIAEVYEIFDEHGARFAGKFLHASRESDDAARARSEQEARLLAGLVHPNIIRVFGNATAIDEQGRTRNGLKLELVDGVDLATEIALHAPMPEATVVDYALQIATGLAAAHARGIVHRDLKPANILIARGDDVVLKIGDFGMARASTLSGVDPSAFTILGTPDYMAPESLEPLAVDARTDLYALGCMLHEMLSGKVPFAAPTPFAILRRHREDPIPPLPASVSPGLRELVVRLMAKAAADRPPSATTVVDRLGQMIRGDIQVTAPIPASTDNACSQCQEPLLPHITLCLNCGAASLTLSNGSHSVIVTGPGEVGDQLDSRHREWLYYVLCRNPSLGLQANRRLSVKIPRLPFVLVRGIDENSGKKLVEALASMGIASITHTGWIFKQRAIRKKFRTLSIRFWAVGYSLFFLSRRIVPGWHMDIAYLLSLFSVSMVVATRSIRPVTERSRGIEAGLSSQLRAALDALSQGARDLEQRHRLALRSIVRRALNLRKKLGDDATYDAALADGITRATEGTLALRRIENFLRTSDLNAADDAVRAKLHERDLLAARLLELDAGLERMVLRLMQAAPSNNDADALSELRLQIEALEEVQKP